MLKQSKIKNEKIKKISKKISQQEYEKKILELADKGLTSEKIGEALRQEGIHPKEYDKKISIILQEKNKYVIPDVKNLQKKLEGIRAHQEKNLQDKKSKRDRERIFARLRKIKEYHKVA